MIPPINDRLLSLEPLSLETNAPALEVVPQPAIDDSTPPGTADVNAAAAQPADRTRSSDIEEVLARDVWTSAARTFDINVTPAEITQRMPSPDELDGIAERVISFLT